MPTFEDQLETVHAAGRQEWRAWLAQNHRTAMGVWLVYYKARSGKPSVQYSEAVREALCFGWIDSKVRSLDEERYRQVFTPRKPQSVWSKQNKQHVETLMAQGLMAEAGLEKVEAAKRDGSWNALDAVEDLLVPADLQQALDSDETAKAFFDSLSNTVKKGILYWIGSAKRPETRTKRIEQVASAASQRKNPLVR